MWPGHEHVVGCSPCEVQICPPLPPVISRAPVSNCCTAMRVPRRACHVFHIHDTTHTTPHTCDPVPSSPTDQLQH